MRKFFFLLLVLSGIFPAYSIDTHWNLEPVVIKNGVSDNTIYNVCYGSDGFIWLSTDKGISRYDGFRFRDYPLIMGIDSLSTPLHQAVKKLCEGPDGLYYALLFQGGITCFDKIFWISAGMTGVCIWLLHKVYLNRALFARQKENMILCYVF